MFDASGDHMVEMYSSMGVVMALYVASIVSLIYGDPWYQRWPTSPGKQIILCICQGC